ncbi:MAG: caspase family protein [Bacteroidota bacterium]
MTIQPLFKFLQISFLSLFTLHFSLFTAYSQKPELILPIGHTDIIRSMAYSPNGRYIATGSNDAFIKIWDAASCKLLKNLNVNGNVNSICFSPDGRYLLAVISDSSVMLWDFISGTVLHRLRGHHDEIETAVFSPDNGKYILTASRDSTAILWDVTTGRKLYTLENMLPFYLINYFSPDGKHIITAGIDNSLKVWETSTGKLVRSIGSFSQSIESASYSPDGKTIVTTANESPAILWNPETGDTSIMLGEEWYGAAFANFSPDGTKIITVNSSYKTLMFDVATGQMEHVIEDTTGYIETIIFSPKCPDDRAGGRYMLFLNSNDIATLYETSSCKIVQRFQGVGERTRHIAFSPDGKDILISADNSFDIWDAATGNHLGKPTASGSMLISATYSPDGKYIATVSFDKKLTLTDAESGRLLYCRYNIMPMLRVATFSPDSKYLAAACADSTAIIWETASGKLYHVLKAHTDAVFSVQFSPKCADDPAGGKYVLTASADKSAIKWQTSGGEELLRFSDNNDALLSAKFSYDGKFIVTSGRDSLATIWDAATGKIINKLKGHHSSIYTSAFSYDGKLIVTAGLDHTAMIWDAATGKKLFTLQGHTAEVHSAVFSPPCPDDPNGGKYIVTTGFDNSIIIWETATGKKLHQLNGHTEWILSTVFSSDCKHILTASGDKTVKLWEVSTGNLVKTFSGHEGPVLSAVFNPKGDLILSASGDSKLKFWDISTGTEVVTLLMLDSANWIALSPDGRFDGSKSGMEELYLTLELEVIPMDAFFEKYYTPNLLSRLLSGEKFEKPEVDFSNIKLPPVVKIISPLDNASFSSAEITITVEVTDRGGGIDEVRCYQNGKLIEGSARGFKPVALAGDKRILTYTLSLLPGQNEIKATAFNTERTEAIPDKINIYSDEGKLGSSLYVITIGINQYKNSKYNLNYAVTDADAFAEAISANSDKIFTSTVIKNIRDNDATKENILNAMNQLAAQANQEDVLIFYFAGHGVMSEESVEAKSDFFLVPYNVTQIYGDNQMLKLNAISSNELMDLLVNIKAQKQLVLLDACQSGGAIDQVAMRGAAEEKAMAQLARSAGVVVLAASGTQQYAAEFKDLGHGVFTYSIIDGLSGNADGGKRDGMITVTELKAWIEDQVPELTMQYRGEVQYPTGYIKGQDFPIKVIVK